MIKDSVETCPELSSNSSMNLTFVVLSEIPEQLLNGAQKTFNPDEVSLRVKCNKPDINYVSCRPKKCLKNTLLSLLYDQVSNK